MNLRLLPLMVFAFSIQSCIKTEIVTPAPTKSDFLTNAKWQLRSTTYQLPSGDSTVFWSQVVPSCSLDDYERYYYTGDWLVSSIYHSYCSGDIACEPYGPGCSSEQSPFNDDYSAIYRYESMNLILKLDAHYLVLMDTNTSWKNYITIDSFLNIQ